MPRARPWTEYEQLILRRALREGGFPLARQRLPRRTASAVWQQAHALGLEPLSDHRLDLVGSAEVRLLADASHQGARLILQRVPLLARRGRFVLGLRCQVLAQLAQRPLPIEAVERPGLLQSSDAARRLRVSDTHFRSYYAPKITSRVPARLASGQTVYLYPLDDVLALRAS